MKPVDNINSDTEWVRHVILLSPTGKEITEELIRFHIAHLKRLDSKGQLVLCGPFVDHRGGMVIVKTVSYDEAKEIAESDPFVKEGVETYEIRPMEVACDENNYLGMG